MFVSRDPARARGNALFLHAQPLRGYAHHAERSSTVGRTMPIGPAAAHERELGGERIESLRIVPAVARMQHLETVQTVGDQRRDPFPCARVGRMREYGEASG